MMMGNGGARKRASWTAATVTLGLALGGATSSGCADDSGAAATDGTGEGSETATSGTGGPTSSGGSSASSGSGSTSETETSSTSTTGTPTECGNGVLDLDEDCDDGNTANNDGCDEDCEATRVVQVGAGGGHSCVLLRSGAVRCWGHGLYGQLGYGNIANIGDDETPAEIGDVEVGGRVVQITVGADTTCAMLEAGTVRCWGTGTEGRLGYGNTDNVGDDETPAMVGEVDVGGEVDGISSDVVTCARVSGGSVRCWGSGIFGDLGYGNTDTIGDDEVPADAGDVDVGGPVAQVVAGTAVCAVLEGGSLRCWGHGMFGRLGYGNTDNVGDDETPADVGDVDVGGSVTQVDTGAIHTCALLEDGTVRCWGTPDYGQLGYGNAEVVGATPDALPSSRGPVQVGGTVASISAGGRNTCARLDGGAVRCWGRGDDGQLGLGNTEDVGDDEVPADVETISIGGTVVQVSTGGAHTCVLLEQGTVRCWGRARDGQLGYGNIENVGDAPDRLPSDAGDVPVW